MTRVSFPKSDKTKFAPVKAGGIQAQLEETGRFPPVSLVISTLDGEQFMLDRFLTYQFSSSVLTPVDAFSFTFVAPDDDTPFDDLIKEGDCVTLMANGIALCRGVIDTTDVEVDERFGEKITVVGRNVLGLLEDQAAISADIKKQFGTAVTIEQVYDAFSKNTRLQGLRKPLITNKPYNFATESGESKLSALLRFIDPLNCLVWADEFGRMVVARPNMSQTAKGVMKLSKTERKSNVLSMKAIRSSALIANAILPVWHEQQGTDILAAELQLVKNKADGPARLRKNGHILSKTVVISNPQGNGAQDLSDITLFKAAAAANQTIVEAYAKRELARANHKELIVQCIVPGHYNDQGKPYAKDQVYKVIFDRGNVNENMYLFQVEYSLDEGGGQRTSLYFCKLWTITADIALP